MTAYRPQIARRMANGDNHTAAWLLSAQFHKVSTGPNAGAWIAWKSGKMAYLEADHPKDMGCNWMDSERMPTLDAAIQIANSEAL